MNSATTSRPDDEKRFVVSADENLTTFVEFKKSRTIAGWNSNRSVTMTSSQHVYEIRPRKDHRGFDLISDRLPLGLLWFEGPDAIVDAITYAKFYSRSHPAIIRVFDESGAVVGTQQSVGDFRECKSFCARCGY